MKLYYRISNNSYQKPRLFGATKKFCIQNFCNSFKSVIDKDNLTIIADCCDADTITMLKEIQNEFPAEIIETQLGNAGSLRHALNLACELAGDEIVYFCEDDYLHLPKSPQLLQEGLKRAGYVTLFDHPDKYTTMYQGGEVSKVIKTASSHWRYTISTCMTFGTTAATLKLDMDVWNEFTAEFHPHDHQIFTKLRDFKMRKLAVCIPGVACHTDIYPTQYRYVMVESWAIDMMIDELERQINQLQDVLLLGNQEILSEFLNTKRTIVNTKTGWDKLAALDSVLEEYKV